MDTLQEYIEIYERRFGRIDNVKFLIGSRKELTASDISEELNRVARELDSGDAMVSDNFPEPGLSDASIFDMLGSKE